MRKIMLGQPPTGKDFDLWYTYWLSKGVNKKLAYFQALGRSEVSPQKADQMMRSAEWVIIDTTCPSGHRVVIALKQTRAGACREVPLTAKCPVCGGTININPLMPHLDRICSNQFDIVDVRAITKVYKPHIEEDRSVVITFNQAVSKYNKAIQTAKTSGGYGGVFQEQEALKLFNLVKSKARTSEYKNKAQEYISRITGPESEEAQTLYKQAVEQLKKCGEVKPPYTSKKWQDALSCYTNALNILKKALPLARKAKLITDISIAIRNTEKVSIPTCQKYINYYKEQEHKAWVEQQKSRPEVKAEYNNVLRNAINYTEHVLSDVNPDQLDKIYPTGLTPQMAQTILKGWLNPSLSWLQKALAKTKYEYNKNILQGYIKKVKSAIDKVNQLVIKYQARQRAREEEQKRKEEEARKRLEEKKKETERINSIKKSITDFAEKLRTLNFTGFGTRVVQKINANIEKAITDWETFKKSLVDEYINQENNIHQQVIEKINTADLPANDKKQLLNMENERHQKEINWVKAGHVDKMAQIAFDQNKIVLDHLQKDINNLLAEIDRIKKEDEMVKKQIQDTQKEIQATQIEIAKIKAQIGG